MLVVARHMAVLVWGVANFLSHSSRDNPQATALRVWLVLQDPPLANEIFLDTDPDAGLRPGER